MDLFGHKSRKAIRENKLKKEFFKRNGGLLLEQRLKSTNNEAGNGNKTEIFSFKELEMATNNFSPNNKIGGGSKGSVFLGKLSDGRKVAVKQSKLEADIKGDVLEFINEVVNLSQINHRSIVKLYGCCLETEVPLLVYEFVPKGDLSCHLHDQQNNEEQFSLSWEARKRIAIEVARALTDMHSSFHLYHRDVKSANILLDDRYKAKIADFGISKSVGVNQTHVTTRVVGTNGYLDPEYAQSGHYRDKSDVYSFGVVLVELLMGRLATKGIKMQDGTVRSLGAHFIKSMESNRLMSIVVARVMQEAEKDEIEAFAILAKSCLNSNGRLRPSMREVSVELERIRAMTLDRIRALALDRMRALASQRASN